VSRVVEIHLKLMRF